MWTTQLSKARAKKANYTVVVIRSQARNESKVVCFILEAALVKSLSMHISKAGWCASLKPCWQNTAAKLAWSVWLPLCHHQKSMSSCSLQFSEQVCVLEIAKCNYVLCKSIVFIVASYIIVYPNVHVTVSIYHLQYLHSQVCFNSACILSEGYESVRFDIIVLNTIYMYYTRDVGKLNDGY